MTISYAGSTKFEGDREVVMLPSEAEGRLSGRVEGVVEIGKEKLIQYGYVPEFGVEASVAMTASPYGDRVKVTYLSGGVPLLIMRVQQSDYEPSGWQIIETSVPESSCSKCGIDGVCSI
jgi:hypothetical protein